VSHESMNLIAAGARWTAPDAVARPSPSTASDRWKRCFDVSAAVSILLAFSPLFVILGLALLTQGRPFLIRHLRVGRGGAQFPCLKFRTMVIDGDRVLNEHLAKDGAARQEWEASRKLKVDPRVTRLGRVLRKSSVDELPQLFNVIRGEMSLVGPRPIVTAETVHYGQHIERYHEVRPGLTGPWQVSGRSDTSYSQRVALDCQYVATRSFRRDLAILFLTVPAVLRSKGSY
jgi:exopolysaccharide production protein ExoY